MCTSPISIRRTNRVTGKTFVNVVPCGKCEECLSKKHSDFAALAVLEARAASSMHFVTLTYDNEHVPLARVRKYYKCVGDEIACDVVENFEFVESSAYRKVAIRQLKRCGMEMDSQSRALSPVSMIDAGKTFGVGRTELPSEFEDSSVYLTPSLRREDVRLWLKRCRVEYAREFGSTLSFRYAAFGEYGSNTFRPHYHIIFLNLTDEQIRWMLSKWNCGFTDVRTIPAFNRDGSPARVKVANYVSKYIAKGCDKFPFIREGLVERPRRFCSVGFGTKCLSDKEVNQFKVFYRCEDLDHRNHQVFLREYLERNKSLVVEGSSFSMPRKIIELLHYEQFRNKKNWISNLCRLQARMFWPTRSASRFGESLPDRKRPDALRTLAMAFKRKQDLACFDAKLRQSADVSNQSAALAFRQVCDAESVALLDREKLAKKTRLTSLTKEKYK